LNTDLLQRLTQAPGIASREERIRAVVIEEMRPLVESIEVDILGNVIGRIGSTGPVVMISAHMDEIGFLVRHIDDRGFLRLQPVGGFDPRVLPAQRVLVHARTGAAVPGVLQPATKPVHLQTPEDRKDLKVEDLFVDLGLEVEDVRATVAIGDMVTLDRPFQMVGDTVVTKALDDRLGVFVMIEALRAATPTHAQLVAVASTQEEVGLRGATTAAYAIDPDVAIALDVTIAGDIPGMPSELSVSSLRAGTAIKVFDSSHLPNPQLVEHLRDIAERHDIPHQLEVLPRGGTDAGAMQRSRAGAAAGTISIPTRYVHSVNEMASQKDIDASVALLAHFLEEVGTRSYGYTS
jgi:tetrahedral aminopeptidase